MKSDFIQHPELIHTSEDIAQVAETLSREDIVAFDTEFVREKTFFPILEILQIASDKESWLIDARALTTDPSMDGKPLYDVLTNPNILKVAHASQNDQECLYTSLNILATPIFDTALAASLCGYGESIGLNNLLRSTLGVRLPKGHARTHWSIRPLPKPLIEYAHSDVIHLVKLGRRMIKKLEKSGRKEWALQLAEPLTHPEAYQVNPNHIVKRLSKSGRISAKDYPVLLELIRWREERIRQLNIPRKHLADDNTMMDLAIVRPKSMEHLLTFRGIAKQELQRQGKHILAAIELGEQGEIPVLDRPTPPNSDESRVIALLKFFIELLADRYEVTPRHLIDPAQYIRLIRSEPHTPDDFVSSEILSAQSCELIGDDLLRLVKGQTQIAIQGGQVTLTQTEASIPVETSI